MKEEVYIVYDDKNGYVGIHKDKVRAEHHRFQRQKFFKTVEQKIRKARIEFID